MVKIINSTDEFEKEVLKSDMPVLVDFYADWCAPCKMVAPIFDKFSTGDYKDKIKFVKVNVDVVQELAVRYNVMSIPTIIIFKDGKIADQKIGALPETMLRSWLDNF